MACRKRADPLPCSLVRRLRDGRPVLRLFAIASLLTGCIAPFDSSSDSDDLTSVDGAEYTIDFDGYVEVPAGASNDVARGAIHRQLKSALGALREKGIGVADRDAQRNLAAAQLPRTRVQVVNGPALDRVRYHYHDTALVEKTHLPTGPVDLTLLYGDFIARAGELIPICSDDATTSADSLWYHYQPGITSCRNAITTEWSAIDASRAGLAADQLSQREADRRFLTTRATLVRQADANETYPEYDQLYGFAGNTSRTKLVVYSFFGVDSDQASPRDNGIVEYMRYERELRRRLPALHVTETTPHAWLLDFYLDGQKVPATWDDVERWIVDRTGFPAAASTTAKRDELLRQVVTNFRDRWIVWSMPVTVKRGSVERTMTVEIRTWYGLEDGSWDIREHARWRYLEAFWHADVFSYTGHSHFGHGPLEPWTYSGSNFPDRYQVMLVNSCLSFNYYDEDFLNMHPGQASKLDVVVNALPAYWLGMGQANAAYIAGLVGGTQSWRQILGAMAVDLPWEQAYDPMRAVNGELDNAYAPAGTPIAVTPN